MAAPVPIAAALAANVASPQRMFAHAFNALEALALHCLAELLGLPPTYQGVFTSGGSVANLVGLGAARQYAAEQLGLDPARDGLAALLAPRIYASTEVHHVVHRAAGVLGYWLSQARLFVITVLSGFAGIAGVFIRTQLAPIAPPTASLFELSLQNIVVAATFGLSPNLVINALQQKAQG
jgi:Pyridoxal-dependent decarboxylase conserved domain